MLCGLQLLKGRTVFLLKDQGEDLDLRASGWVFPALFVGL